MRSRTEPLERVLRTLALLALGAAWWTSRTAARDAVVAVPADTLVVARDDDAADRARSGARLAARLSARLADAGAAPVHLRLREVPAPELRALLQAGREAGVSLTWSAVSEDGLPPLGLSLVARDDPQGGALVRATTGSGRSLTLRDAIGWLDSARVDSLGITWTLPSDLAEACVDDDGTRACARSSARAARTRVRVYATPGWEGQFTVRALEEAGYTVDARFAIAPRVEVRAGRPEPLDTGRYVAVVALDSAAWPDAPAIARFVRAGGGLVVVGGAAFGAPSALPLAGAVATALPAIPGALRGPSPREGLPLHPIVRPARDAVVLERGSRPGEPVALAARRVGLGRVVQAGWSALWEWRMTGGEDAVGAHREWWRTQLARAAGARATTVDTAANQAGAEPPRADVATWHAGDAAPLADLVARVGPAAPATTAMAPTDRVALPSPGWLVTAALALVVEWWLRRRRGAR